MLEIIHDFAKWLALESGAKDFAYAGQLVYLPVIESRMMQAVMAGLRPNPALKTPADQTRSGVLQGLAAKIFTAGMRRKIKAVLIFLSILAIGYLIYLESLEYLNR
ncbi:MAG: hypothetical protein KDK39_11685 [Leptospiraceae bacterium]|nr:hypothetical protein [Leptospiraceae bacterium]